jgi:hypothetical protein
MSTVNVRLRPLVRKLNLPTVIRTAILPGDFAESLFIATQVGEIFCLRRGEVSTLLDIRSRVLKLGAGGGYDERGLLGLAFHPGFYTNGLFYLHYSVAGTQGPGALAGPFRPSPCDPGTLRMSWNNREAQYDHIDTVEEWVLQPSGAPRRRRTLLNLRRPFLNHNGVNSLNFSPETGRLVLTTGDGGSGYDPFNLAQDDREIAGKIVEIDVAKDVSIEQPPAVTRFHELPASIQDTLTVIAKGVRNIPGIAYQRFLHRHIKYVGVVGQDLVESIYSFVHYRPVPVTQLVQAAQTGAASDHEGMVNFGWRAWEGAFPTSVRSDCPTGPDRNEVTAAYYDEAIRTSARRLPPLVSYFHRDSRPDRFGGTALTGVQPYRGSAIPALAGSVVFTDLARQGSGPRARGVLGYARARPDGRMSDYQVMEINHDFGGEAAYFVSLGVSRDQSRLYLGVYGSMKVADPNLGTVYEIVP